MPSPRADTDDALAVRRATPGDAPQVARLLHDFQREYDEPSPGVEALEERYEELIRNKEMIVLLGGDGPDGFAQLRFRPWVYSAGLHSYLEELYVVPDLRGNGLGRALLEAAMETARTEGAEQMELGTSEDDVAARKLYESSGFINREGGPDGPVMFFYEREL
ncbi:MAG TPA: GNAT family N-acetyltransferase [Solirubrobacterales bacterium]|jgi:ribosomal protein S18 acetylase RimI-like enzyme|nr:GNAT family N-acetyltransferase [Solirubrobacterales bacterium]